MVAPSVQVIVILSGAKNLTPCAEILRGVYPEQRRRAQNDTGPNFAKAPH